MLKNIDSNEAHFDCEYNGDVYHFQLVDNELNQDAIIFTTTLAKTLGIYSIDYRKYNSPGEKFYVRSKYINFKKLTEGSNLINSYNIEKIREEFISANKLKGEELFSQFCKMIILDIFTLNCDRTHNNWLVEADEKILSYDYNFTFGSADLLHGVTNQGLNILLADGIIDNLDESLISSKNEFLYGRFEKNHRLDMADFAEYTIVKSSRDTAHTKIGDEETGLVPSCKNLIRYFIKHDIEADLINKIMNLSAEIIFENVPADSKINSCGNKKYLAYMFDYLKNLIQDSEKQ